MRTTIAVLALILAAQVAGAEDAKISLDVADMPLGKLASVIARQGGLQVVVDPAMASKKVTMSIECDSARKALDLLAALEGVKVVPLGEKAFWLGGPLPAWKAAVLKSVHGTIANVNFEGTGLVDALEFLAATSGTSVVLDPAVLDDRDESELQIGLHVEKVPVATLLELIAQSLDLAWDVRWGCVLVSTPERLASLPKTGLAVAKGEAPPAEKVIRERLAKETVTFDFQGTPTRQVFKFIAAVRRIEITIDPAARELLDDEVTMKVSGLALGHVLDVVLVPRGCGCEVTESGVKIVANR